MIKALVRVLISAFIIFLMLQAAINCIPGFSLFLPQLAAPSPESG